MRATQKKMMSKPVTSVDDGRNVFEFDRLARPAERGVAPQRGREPRVEHILVARERRRRTAELRLRLQRAPPPSARHVDVAVLVVPRGNLVAPPQLARNAPVLDVVDPVVIGGEPLAGHEAHLLRRAAVRRHESRVDRFEAELLDRLARKERMRGRRGLGQRHEPLVGQHRLDHLAGAAAARHHHLVRLLRHQQPRGGEIGQHGLARDVAIEPAILRRRVVVHRRVEMEDRDRREPVPLSDLPVVEVMRRRDLDGAGAELAVDIGVRHDRNRAPGQRQRDALAHERTVALVVRIHRDGHVTQHRLGPRGGDHDRARPIRQRIADLPQLALLFLAVDLEIRHRGAELRVPVDETLAAIDEAVFVQAHEGFQHRRGQAVVHREALARPVGGVAQAPHLLRDRRARLLLPRPHALDEARHVPGHDATCLPPSAAARRRSAWRCPRGRCPPATACCRRACGGTGSSGPSACAGTRDPCAASRSRSAAAAGCRTASRPAASWP